MTVVGNRNKKRSESKDDDDDKRKKKKRSSSRSSSRQKRKKTKQSSSRSSSRQKRKKTKQSSSRSSSRQKRKKTKQSTGTTDTTDSMLRKLRITAEITPPKSLVIIWILMAAELGFDLITTGIAFFSSMAGKTECCGSNASMGPFPMATTVPFFLLIVAEITFLGRAILLTLWPRTYETSRIATHGGTDDDDDDDVEGGNKTEPKRDDNVQELYNSEIPEFSNGRNRNSKKSRGGCFCSCLKCFCSCFLRWNAKMVLCILNLLTLLNPFFGCLIAWILLYQSDKTESFIVLGIESLSIILHFISVRMEGGLRTWYSKLLHSVAILPFLVTVTLVLVYIREGGVCYSVEKEMFSFSGCEICPDTLLPPDINGMCFESTSDGGGGNYTSSSVYSLAGSGGFLQDVQDLGNINGIKDIQNNFANLIDRGADQDSYCSPDTNFCFYKF